MPSTCAALFQSVSVAIVEAEYLTSYSEAVPMLPSSPVAVQKRETELYVASKPPLI